MNTMILDAIIGGETPNLDLLNAIDPEAISPELIYQTAAKIETLNQATVLWNWIDAQDDPEPLWEMMMLGAPWAFRDGSPNSIRFTY